MVAGAGGRGGRLQRADRGKWLGRYREGDRELLDRSSRPQRVPTRLPQERVRAIEALRRLRMTAAEIAEILRAAALDRLAVAEADRARQALAARAARAAQPLRAPPSGRARARRHQAARPHLARCRPPRDWAVPDCRLGWHRALRQTVAQRARERRRRAVLGRSLDRRRPLVPEVRLEAVDLLDQHQDRAPGGPELVPIAGLEAFSPASEHLDPLLVEPLDHRWSL